MSSMDQKVEVIGEFLQNRAQLQRVTGFEEIQRVAGQKLAEKGYRLSYSNVPVRRSDVAQALAIIADQSFKDAEILLPAIVVHFWDADPPHQFYEWATTLGLLSSEADLEERRAVYKQQVEATLAFYASKAEAAIVS